MLLQKRGTIVVASGPDTIVVAAEKRNNSVLRLLLNSLIYLKGTIETVTGIRTNRTGNNNQN